MPEKSGKYRMCGRFGAIAGMEREFNFYNRYRWEVKILRMPAAGKNTIHGLHKQSSI